MNINTSFHISKFGFNGVAQPKKIFSYSVIPISVDPNFIDIKKAVHAEKKSKNFSDGLNGRAFFLGEDLVVKKYFDKNHSVNYNPNREITALDKMFENNIINPSFQVGLYAFSTPDNRVYLVSNRIKGSSPDVNKNKFNYKNLSSIVNALFDLDCPRKFCDKECERNFSAEFLEGEPAQGCDTKLNKPMNISDKNNNVDQKINDNLSYFVPMHYDLSSSNIVISQNNAGIIDFEYLQFENLNQDILSNNIHYPIVDCNFSDIVGIPSNLRNFEYRAFLSYLMKLDSDEALHLFSDYLLIKSNYHSAKESWYNKEIADNQNNLNFNKDLFEQLSKKEKAHSVVLKEHDIDVIRAEAYKIQLASFIYKQSQFDSSCKTKININQIKNYIKKVDQFFTEKYENSMGYKKQYYKDCCDLMSQWKFLDTWMDDQKQIAYFLENSPEIFEPDSLDEITKNSNLFMSKLTDDECPCLDKHLLKNICVN